MSRPTRTTAISIDRDRFPIDLWSLVEIGVSDNPGLSGTLFAIGNGYLGLRADHSPDPESAGTYVNGFHETFPIRHAEQAFALAKVGQSLLNAPDAKSARLTIGGHHVEPGPDVERRLAFRSGVLTSRFTWTSPDGTVARVESERIASFARPHLAVLRLTVTLIDVPVMDGPGQIELASLLVNRQDLGTAEGARSGADPRGGRTFDHRVLVPQLARVIGQADGDGAALALGYRTAESGMTIGVACRHQVEWSGAEPLGFRSVAGDDEASTTLFASARAGDTLTVTKFVAYHTAGQVPGVSATADVDQLIDEALATIDSAAADGWETMLAEQRKWLDRFWERSDIAVGGDEAAQQAIRWNLFQMAQASARTGERGIAAKAVTAGGYDGHYFWDTEIYVIPMLAYTDPHAARELLRFRYKTLAAARRRATEMSQRGALFPWRTINGEEASAYYPAGTAQYHIDADIAHAIDRYVNATGDEQFLHHEGAEMLVELARLFADLGFYDKHEPPRFHIHGVTGPDEYTAVVDDNLYTNVMARFTLRLAAHVVETLAAAHPFPYRRLTEATTLVPAEPAAWRRAADAMYVPYDEERGINPQDDSFLDHAPWDWEGTPADEYPLLLNFHPLVIYRHQVLKQADVVMAMYLKGDEFDRQLQRRNFDFYDPITTGDSSLSACVQSIMASEVGRPDLALHYFGQSLYLDIANTHGNTSDGAHIANIGGVWAAIVHGFAGIRDDGHSVRVEPRLPDGWTLLSFRLQRRGSVIGVTIDPAGATVEVVSGGPVMVSAGGDVHRVETGHPLLVTA